MSKLSQLIFCFIFVLLNVTITPLLHAENKIPTTTVEDNCNLPAPTGLTITDVTAFTADATWNAVPGAVGYSVVAKNLATQQVYFSTTTTGTSITATGLPANTNIKLEVSPICVSGNTGGTTEAVITTDVIIDVLVGQFNGCNNNDGWTIHVPGELITIPVNTPYELKLKNIKTSIDVLNFSAHGYGSQVSDKIYFYPTPTSSAIIIEDQASGGVYLKDNNTIVVNIECAEDQQQNYKLKTGWSILDGYQLSYRPIPESCNWTPGIGSSGGGTTPPVGGGRSSDDEAVSPTEPTITAAPNPFQAQFSLLANGYKNEPATIQLYNLSGQLVQSITTILDDQSVSVVNTEDLPDGMYIAKIQTSQAVKTIKVQKTSPK